MKEEDIALAKLIVAESEEASPGCSPAPLRKTLLTKLKDKTNTFR